MRRRQKNDGRFRGVAAVVAGALLGTAAALITAAPAQASSLRHLEFPVGGPYEWTVPEGVTSITVDVYGGAGGQGWAEDPRVMGGGRGHITATLPVTPGDTYWFVVGGRGTAGGGSGAGGFNGGGTGGLSYDGQHAAGGGGATDIRHGGQGLDDRILVVGGGGGDSGPGIFPRVNANGGSGSAGTDTSGGAGFTGAGWVARGGGGATDSPGTGGTTFFATTPNDPPSAWTVHPEMSGLSGAAGAGGNGADGINGGGGGGGGGAGWYGGGGGGASGSINSTGGGGGGGSSWVAPGITVTVAEEAATNASGRFALDFEQPEETQPYITGAPGDAVVGQAYSYQFTTDGYPTPTCSAPAADLPDGLTLDPATCTLTGRPGVPGRYPFTVTATNRSAAWTLDTVVVVVARPPTIVAAPAANALAGEPIDTGFLVDGDPAPTVVLDSGDLPPGVELQPSGWLVGTPTTAGSYTFTVRASNGADPDALMTWTLTVIGGIDTPAQPSTPSTITGIPSSGSVRLPYDFTYTLGGDPAPTTTVTDGALPPGLSLDEDGRLTGAPTTAGLFTFTVTATNRDGRASVTSTVEITAPVTVSSSCATVLEGNSGTRRLTFTLTLSRPSTETVTVPWATANGTASAGKDYVAGSGVVTFAPGQTRATVTVVVRGDRVREGDETVRLRLSGATGAVVTTAVATGRIRNDD